MGFSTIGASVVLFIGMLFVASTLMNAAFDGQRDTMLASRDDRDRDRFAKETDATITSSNRQGPIYSLEVVNQGGTTLDPSRVFAFFDGQWVNPQGFTREVDGQTTTVWAPGQTLELGANVGGGGGNTPDRVWLVLETGQGLVWIE